MTVARRNWIMASTLAASCVASAQQSQPASMQADEPRQSADAPTHYHTRAGGARPEPDPPSYVQPISAHGKDYGIDSWQELDWLDFGLEHRTRFELYDDDYSRDDFENRSEQFLMRSRAYLGVREVLDPFRFAFEFQDSRQFMGNFPEDNQDVDEADFLQAVAEIYLKDALGAGYPFRFQFGRMTFDYVDRKIVGRNRWRNTTNSFDGFRVILGQPSSDWQFDFVAAMPVERRLRQPDRSDEERWLYGLVGAWRAWSDVVTLEPYYFILDEDQKDPDDPDREIHTMGLHAFGPIGKSGFDYDMDAAFQFGKDGDRKQRAFAAQAELGYTFEHVWTPRVSITGAYASGDRVPDDNFSERFDRQFGTNHHRSTADLLTWQNIIYPKLRLEFQPHPRIKIDGAYGAYWLASDSDAWVVPNRRDPEGESGDFIGQELEIRARFQIHENMELDTGYSYFMPGAFTRNTGAADDSDFFYVTMTLKF